MGYCLTHSQSYSEHSGGFCPYCGRPSSGGVSTVATETTTTLQDMSGVIPLDNQTPQRVEVILGDATDGWLWKMRRVEVGVVDDVENEEKIFRAHA